MKNGVEVSQKTENRTTISPSKSNPGYISKTDKQAKKHPKTLIQKDTFTSMSIAALFTVSKKWKQPKCPSTDEWIKKMWYTCTMEYSSAIKKNEILPFEAPWMDLKGIILREITRREREILYNIPFMWNLKNTIN